jgi:(S)-mandelate dehydrogenase
MSSATVSCRAPHRLQDCYVIEDLRQLARRRLPQFIFDFFDGGSEQELTLSANQEAFQHWAWRPHVLRDVSQPRLGVDILGQAASLPMAIAPTGAGRFGHPDAELGLARAAREAGIPYALSSSATTLIETIAEQAGGRLWFQAYVLKERDYFWQLLQRAESAGFEALIITVDLAVGGKRVRDFHNHFAIPFQFTPRNIVDALQHPSWLLQLLQHGMPVMENLRGMARAQSSSLATNQAIASTVGRGYDAGFDLERLREVRDRWKGKLIVKGIARADDAALAADIGADLLVVSNHGGRQLDGALASLDCLPEVVQAVGHRCEVWLDGGIRHGGDVAKAMALGARGVLCGRATLYGAIAAGEAGARRSLEILRDEYQRTLQLCGLTDSSQWSRDLLTPTRARVQTP